MGFAATVQDLQRAADKVLVVGEIVGLRNEDGWFTPGEVAQMMEALRLPRVHVSQALAGLGHSNFVLRRSTGGAWSLTPRGHTRARELVGAVNAEAVDSELAQQPGADLGEVRQPVLPP